ncbi:hypothetical protein HPB47_004346, partial [Ixodes persulcatus]
SDIRIINQLHPITPYLAAPLNASKGVIRSAKRGLSSDELMYSLESYKATIITTRMMGATESVIMTFEGPTQSPIPCSTDEQHTAVKCERCRAYGHSALNCPEAPTFWRCTTCAPPLQQQQVLHPCTPWRYHCGGEHTRVDPASEVQQRTDKTASSMQLATRESISAKPRR